MRFYLTALLVAVLSGLAVSSAGALDINTEVSLQDGLVGAPYEFQFTASEGCSGKPSGIRRGRSRLV